MFEVPCWYSYDNLKNSLIIWEGVMAIWNENCKNEIECVELWKEYNNNYVNLFPLHNIKSISSDGYWTCAEVTGKFNNEKYFFYHAITPEKNIEITLDPNPYRNWSETECESRLKKWKDLCYNFSNNLIKINKNYNMPI
uniref:Uncharacterized protein n=1 Tax=Strongyloides stercoralis TaxID=6248 RepID=A0A0K0EH03_STRER